jgi:hypothetical protein
MAANKRNSTLACAVHCLCYTLPFILLTHSVWALLAIYGTHFLIDRFGLARCVIWAKNHIGPNGYYPWNECRMTGYYDEEVCPVWEGKPKLKSDIKPIWMRIWLLIITDNTLHLLCNALALAYLA